MIEQLGDSRLIREIDDLDQITPTTDFSAHAVNMMLSIVCHNAGVHDMHDVVANYMDMKKYLTMTETVGPDNRPAYSLQFELEPTFENAEELSKKFASIATLSFAVAMNEKFKVLWQLRYEPNGILGETWEKGYVFFRRSAPQAAYLSAVEIYLDQYDKLLRLYRARIDVAQKLQEKDLTA